MTVNDLIDIIGNTDDRIIEEAKTRQRPVISEWIKWAAAAACLCLIAGGLAAIVRTGGTTSGKAAELPQIEIPEYESEDMGFEGLMYYSAEELENGNPWREDLLPDSLPVFRNGCCYDSSSGVLSGLSEAEMTAELESAAEALGLEIRDTQGQTSAEKIGDTIFSIRAAAGNGRLTVYSDGALVYELPGGCALPEKYHFTRSSTSDSEADAVMGYLTETYASFLNFDHPEVVLQGDYTFDGDYIRRYIVYDSGEDMTERILNYNLRAAQFAPDDNGNLMLIRISDGLRKAEKLGDYPLISAAEAKEKLLNGQYQTSVPGAMPGEKYIAKTELVYRSGLRAETILPYYRFYIELQDTDGWKMTQDNGLKTYGAYYVPAIRDEYISNLSAYHGEFN